MIICFLILAGTFLWLQVADELWMLYLFAVIYGFAHGGLFTLMSPWIAELFGLDSHGAIFGTVGFVGIMGGALGPVLFGRIFDVTRSYQLAFLVCTVISIVAIILSLLVRPLTEARKAR
jgi:MFS family permease